MEGPYRDLGAGFARLGGPESLRRTPPKGTLRYVEDALFELLRNARDAGARNIYVASSLKSRRYRHLVVIDDGAGIPKSHERLIFEPGVTTRHLSPVLETKDEQTRPTARPNVPNGAPLHGAGLSLYHIKAAALSAEVLSTYSPTAIKAVFDTHTLPEKSLQSSTAHRPSNSNLPATLTTFASNPNTPHLYHGSPARILARLLKDQKNHIIQTENRDLVGARRFWEAGRALGLEVSLRTAQRVLSGKVLPAGEVSGGGREQGRLADRPKGDVGGWSEGGPTLSLGEGEVAAIGEVLRRVARSRYLEVGGLEIEERPGVLILKARVYEPEEEYE